MASATAMPPFRISAANSSCSASSSSSSTSSASAAQASRAVQALAASPHIVSQRLPIWASSSLARAVSRDPRPAMVRCATCSARSPQRSSCGTILRTVTRKRMSPHIGASVSRRRSVSNSPSRCKSSTWISVVVTSWATSVSPVTSESVAATTRSRTIANNRMTSASSSSRCRWKRTRSSTGTPPQYPRRRRRIPAGRRGAPGHPRVPPPRGAHGGLSSWPGAPRGDLDHHCGTHGYLLPVLLVLGGQQSQGPFTRVPVVLDAARPVEAHPPQPRPVLLVVVDQQRGDPGGAQVLEPDQVEGRLRLVVDGGVDRVALEDEAAGDDGGGPARCDRGQPAHPRLRHAAPHGLLVHGVRREPRTADAFRRAGAAGHYPRAGDRHPA